MNRMRDEIFADQFARIFGSCPPTEAQFVARGQREREVMFGSNDFPGPEMFGCWIVFIAIGFLAGIAFTLGIVYFGGYAL